MFRLFSFANTVDFCRIVIIINRYAKVRKVRKVGRKERRYAKGKAHSQRYAKGHVFGTVKIGDKGQIVIPKEARQVFGLSPGDSLLVLGDEENGIVLARAEVLNHVAMEILGKVNSPQKDERE